MEQRRPRLLLVEDDRSVLDSLTAQFRSAGFEVSAAPDGAAAKTMLGRSPHDVALIDCGLPDTDGVRLHGEIFRLAPALAAATVFMSGRPQPAHVLDYIENHGCRFLLKPFTAREVLAIFRSEAAEPQPVNR